MANSTISQIKVGGSAYDIKPASAYVNTDTKVKQTSKSSGTLPILLASATNANAAGEAYYNAALKYNTGTGSMTVSDVTGAYFNIHPENGPALIPFIHNDIAFVEAQGGIVSMYKVASTTDMTLATLPNQTAYKPSNYENCFDASPSYMNMSGFTKGDTATSFIIDIALPRVFSYSNIFYIDFGATVWRASNITVLVSHTNMTNYVQKAAITDLALGHYKVVISHSFTASGATSVTYGFNKLRIVLTNWQNASPRIAQIGLYNYGSSGTRYTMMSRGIDDQVWRSITPAKNNTYNLGRSSNKWNNIYGTNVSATNVTAAVIKAEATANQDANKYFATNGTIQTVPTIPVAIRNPQSLTIQFNEVTTAIYDGNDAITVNIPTLDTVTATVATAANGTTPTVTVTTAASSSERNATFAFNLPNAKDGISIGTVTASATTLANSATPTVTVTTTTSGTNKNCTFAFGIPKGEPGTSVGTIAATVASVASNVAPSVTVSTTVSGTNKNVTMAFKLPKGDTGSTGVVSVVTAGTGNAVTSASYNSATKTITLTKGATFATSGTIRNYLPLSGGTMTGPIVQNSNFRLLTESFTGQDGYFNLCTGFDLYNTLGKNFAYLNSNGGFYLYNHNTGSDGTEITPNSFYIYDQWSNNTVFSLNRLGDSTSVSYGELALQLSYINGDDSANVVLSSRNCGTITLREGGTTSVVISGTQAGDLSGYARIDLYDDTETKVISLDSRDGLVFHSANLRVTADSNGELLHYRNISSVPYEILDSYNYSSILSSSYVLKSGDAMTGSLTAPAFYQTSDIRKKNITGQVSLDKCYEMLDKCLEIIYTLKDQTKEQIGLIAQEVEEFFPEVIDTDAEGYKSLDYAKLVVVCLKLIKDLSSRISKLEKNG